MKEYMMLEAEALNQKEVHVALHRAHELRSEMAWEGLKAIVVAFKDLFKGSSKDSHVSGGSGLAHS